LEHWQSCWTTLGVYVTLFILCVISCEVLKWRNCNIVVNQQCRLHLQYALYSGM